MCGSTYKTAETHGHPVVSFPGASYAETRPIPMAIRRKRSSTWRSCPTQSCDPTVTRLQSAGKVETYLNGAEQMGGQRQLPDVSGCEVNIALHPAPGVGASRIPTLR